ncbi:MAG: glycoside hydrolase [Calditrichaeota bacterium]|nr:MAG: glycoside hydrolase [Calditrichota bacterium]
MVVAASFFTALNAQSSDLQRYKKIVELRGMWRFQIGDNPEWKKFDLDDRSWGEIFVPADWEDEGYSGYDGIAWYRKSFTMPEQKYEAYNLFLGYIDDADEVFLNGHFIGGLGDFYPGNMTAYDQQRIYNVPAHYFNFGAANVIAVRVYDKYLNGGIVGGNKIGIFTDMSVVIPLAGVWKFKMIDYDLPDDFYENPGDDWMELDVPKEWGKQGLDDYDGYGWYRKKVVIPSRLENQALILVLGKIDDYDETYFNGQRIGRTGRFSRFVEVGDLGDTYLQMRIYRIPAEIIKFDKENIIDVRVYDGFQHGGIYEGPIGITTQAHLQYLMDENPPSPHSNNFQKKSIWDVLLDLFEN